jgi:phage tail protein X
MTYTTKQGDTWDGIAKSLYGDEKYTKQLMRANGLAYLSTVVFAAGVVLTVPDVDTVNIIFASALPPWRT